jgi:hypothetical protein
MDTIVFWDMTPCILVNIYFYLRNYTATLQITIISKLSCGRSVYHFPRIVAIIVAIMLYTLIREVFGSNFGRYTDYPDRVFSWLLSVSRGKCQDSAKNNFLPNNSQFILSSYQSMFCTLKYRNHRTTTHRKKALRYT